MRTLAQTIAFGQTAAQYAALRQAHPLAPAAHIKRYIDAAPPETFEQFGCKHEFSYSGTAYGGDDESYYGEGRAYCVYCGIDGDS